MLGMVVHAETSAQSIAVFIRGTHDTGNFIELLAQYQYESQTQNADKRFWTFHGCIFRVSFGHVTSGEMIDPTLGVWTYLSELNSRQRRMQCSHAMDHWDPHKTGQKKLSPKSRDPKQSRLPICINRHTVQTGSTYAAWDSQKCALRLFTSHHSLGETRTQMYVTNGLCSCRIAYPIR